MDTKESLERLESFKFLERGWDSYDGLPPDHTAIEKAKQLVEGFFVCPLNSGNIAISLGDEDVTLVVDNQGGVSVVII